ncbi:MAG: signal peptidase I [Myxococcales bacterium]|nr:signal peptidase I [Myxococcales bacterium]
MAQSQSSSGGSVVGMIIQLAIVVLVIASLWKVFSKAGQPGWAAIIPIYNLIVLAKVAGKSPWLILLFFVPFVGGLIFMIIMGLGVAQNFGKGAGFGIGLGLLGIIFYPILAFGSATYSGRAA